LCSPKAVVCSSINAAFNYFHVFSGIPAVIVGAVACIRPSTYDMGAALMADFYGEQEITVEVERVRYVLCDLVTIITVQRE